MLLVGKRRVALPNNLTNVTHVNRVTEVDPITVGLDTAAVERIWSRVEAVYRTAVHPAVSLAIRHRGEVIMDRSIGCIRGNLAGEQGPAVPIRHDDPQCVFSASKAITAVLLHKLVDDGKLSLDDEIRQHIPEFAAGGKAHITIRDLLIHRAGVAFIPQEHADPDLLGDWERIIRLLCESPSQDGGKRRQSYHALTAGFITGEIIRRVGDIELQTALQEWIAKPLGCKHMSFGLAPEHRERAAFNACTGQAIGWPISAFLQRVTVVPFEEAVAESNNDAFMSAIIPAGNIYATADDLTRFFQMLLNGGEFEGNRILQPETVAAAIRPPAKVSLDYTLFLPTRYSAGFMIGEDPAGMFGPKSGDSYGHLGLMNILAWADPRRELSVALTNTGKSMAAAGTINLYRVIMQINREFDL